MTFLLNKKMHQDTSYYSVCGQEEYEMDEDNDDYLDDDRDPDDQDESDEGNSDKSYDF